MNEPTMTSAARKVLDEYNAACRDLAAASHALNQAEQEFKRAVMVYNIATGAARAMQVTS